MIANRSLDVGTAQVKHHRRQSLIPTPSIGTSRKASPTLAYRNKPPPRLPRSESMLPYTDRTVEDVSGTRQQLNIRNFSIKSLEDPTDVVAPTPALARPKLPKSKTSNSISSYARRQTIPDRHLLKPILAPLPYSQSLSNASCFSAAGLTPSPAKPLRQRLPTRHPEPVVSAVDAIHESRMTAHEIEVLNQVQREATSNRDRLKLRYSSGNAQTRSTGLPSPDDTEDKHTPTRRVEDAATTMQSRPPLRAGRKSLTINTQLANSATIRPVLASTQSVDGASDASAINPKHVYFPQDQAYWLGRYVAVCDRLRSKAMNGVLDSVARLPGPSSPASEISYEAAERECRMTALQELRANCQTTKTLQSFQSFECQMLGSGRDSSQQKEFRPGRMHTTQHALSATAVDPAPKARVILKTKAIEVAPMKKTRTDIALPSILGRLAKSKTTGDMANMFGTSLSASISSNRLAPREQSRRPTLTVHNRRKSSATTASLPTSVQHSKATPLIGFSHHVERDLNSPQRPPVCHCRTSSFGSERFDELARGITTSTLEGGHSRPPSPTSAGPSKYKVSITDGEKVIRSRRDHQRRSSGDVMKDIWGVGTAQLRKMRGR